MPRDQSSTSRCLGLDVLRAVAILMVLCSHWTAHFSGWLALPVPAFVDVIGDTGVEIFFALSGFLIGRILLGIIASRPTWADFRVFMIRRALRTLPLYFLWLTLLLSVFPPQQDAMVTALRFLTLTQNLLTDMPADYYFVVTWSLTIEEWFYLLFGAALIFLARRTGGSRALAWCLAVFMLGPLALRLAYVARGPLVLFRIDEIAYGVLMAQLYLSRSVLFRYPRAALSAGLGLMAAALAGVLPIPAGLLVPLTSNAEVIGAALCLPAALRLSHAAWWLEVPIRWVAARSYALYLTHLTILVDVTENELLAPGRVPMAGCIAVAVIAPFLLAALSYRFLELPLLRLRPSQDRARVGALPAAAAVVA